MAKYTFELKLKIVHDYLEVKAEVIIWQRSIP